MQLCAWALQSALIAAACLVVGMSHGSGLHAWLPGVLTIAVKVLFIPYAILLRGESAAR